MSVGELAPSENRERPLVLLIWSLPLVKEALVDSIDFAEVRAFETMAGNVLDLLRSLTPDAVVVDSEAGAMSAELFARANPLPVLYLSLPEASLRVLRGGVWVEVAEGFDPAPGTVRNVLAGELFARRGTTA